jgi:hypothetical protein
MPPAHGIKRFVSEIPGAIPLQAYFYENLQSDEWLPWLAEAGLLSEPLPDALISNALRLWSWPVGRYLIRMAASPNAATRKAVSDSIRALEPSNHPDVQRFGIDVVDTLPANEAAALVDIVCNWLTPNNAPYLTAPHKIIATLAKAGFVEPALRVARTLFRVFKHEGRLAAFFDNTMYEHYLNEAVATLASSGPLDALPVFCDLLQQASRIDGRLRGPNKVDHTYYSVESLAPDQPAGHDIHAALSLSIVRLTQAAIQAEPRGVVRVHKILQAYEGRIYRRMQMHVISLAPHEAPDLAEAYLMDEELLDASWCRDEYAKLANAWFPSLAPAKQRIILDEIDAIPKGFFDKWKSLFEQREHRLPTAEEERAYWATSIRDIFWKWRDALPSERRTELGLIVAEFGDPDAWRNRFFASGQSPLSREAMQSQAIDDTIAYLNVWRPDPGIQTHTVSALSNELREAVANNPTLFSLNAEKFGHLRPIFIRRMLEGIRQPTVNGTRINWSQILALAKAVLNRTEISLDSTCLLADDDSDWSLTLAAFVDVLAGGLRRGTDGIEFGLANIVQPLVLALYARVARLPKPDTDPFDIKHPYFSAEQTILGASIELCILLLFWLTKNPVSTISKAPREALSYMPDVRIIFEEVLKDKSTDGRITRAIFGRYLGLLGYFGEKWVRQQMPNLFPADNQELREAAWISHLQSDSGPFSPLTDELNSCYAGHIARLGENADREISNNRLSEYLMVLYLWDELPEALLDQFWQFAPATLRRRAMWFIGQQLGGANEIHKARAISYWERRLQLGTKANDPDSYRKELGTIGQWFLWKVDDSWLMDQLLLVLNAGFAPNDGLGIVDKLAEQIPEKIDQVVEITKALVRCPEMDSWILVSQAASIRKILVEGKKSDSSTTRASVQEIISYLSSRGNTSFLDLS